jgi:hypothetical protein
MRCIVLTSLLLMLAAPPSWAQVGFDRPGADYTSFSIRTGDPAVCALRCEREARCRAWAFSYPNGESAAVCWLKSQVPQRIGESGSVSGVRGAGVIEPKGGPVEFAIDRGGGDYKSVELDDPTGLACKAACEGAPLLSQGQGQAAPSQAVLHFRGGEIAGRRLRCRQKPANNISSAPMILSRSLA